MENSYLFLKNLGWAILVFLLHLVLSEWISIGGIRPDIFAIFTIYFTIRWGGFYGVILGFICGLLIDLGGTGNSFGLSAIIYTFMGYTTGWLYKRRFNITTLYLTVGCSSILVFALMIDTYLRYPVLLDANLFGFFMKWIAVSIYTLGFMLLLHYAIPLKRMIVD